MTSKTTEPIKVRLEQIEAAPDNLRQKMTDLDDLAASIKAQGLLQPFLLTTNGTDKYKIVAGHRRQAAIALLIEAGELEASTEFDAVLRPDMDDAARIEAMAVENLQRTDLNPIEEALAYQSLVQLGRTQKEVGERVGRNQSTISKRLLLLTLAENLQRLVAKGTLPVEVGQLLAKLENQESADLLVQTYGPDLDEWRITTAIKNEQADKALVKLVEAGHKANLPILSRAELTSDYSWNGEQFKTVKEAAAFVAGPEWGGDDWYFVGVASHDGAVLKVYGPKPKNKANTPEAKAQENAKIERIINRLKTEAFVNLVAKPDKAKLLAALVDTVVAVEVTHSNAGLVCKYLDLEPLATVQRVTDYATGEVKEKVVKDYIGTVKDWAGQDDKKKLQTLAAVMFARYHYTDGVATYLTEHGFPSDEDLRARATEA